MTYDARAAAVTKCILYAQDRVENMRASGDKANLRSAQLSVSIDIGIAIFSNNSAPTSNFLLLYYFLLQLRLYKNELSIEEVIRGRTQGIFHEKCRDYYTISNSNSWYSEVFKTLDIFSYVIACSTKSSIQIPSL